MEENPQAPSPQTPQNYDILGQIPPPSPPVSDRLLRVFLGPQGLRAGWSALLFALFTLLFGFAAAAVVGLIATFTHKRTPTEITAFTALVTEVIQVLVILLAGLIMARIEHRRLRDYFLAGQRRLAHFFVGAIIGFVALSALVGALALGGWLHFGAVQLPPAQIAGYGLVWAAVFLLTGFFEEGSFRCYLQFTFTRGINFWWALAVVAAACLDLALRHVGPAAWGVYIVALLGLLPCLWLHTQRSAGSSFWQATWATSTLFGFIHITNSGENWVGIFSAAAIGFVFCLSVWVTGSAWWAIGCHAAWDWAETFFYGTADSGIVPRFHFLTTAPAGNVFWSGGTDGPEGSILILGILVLLVIVLLVIYGRRRAVALPEPAVQEPAS
ncbi:MAG TPA: CPBP family intramembrane glutamic endopeptidase [Terracidiphilus sp.]|nr:CPBP family intramembrane glutamic endopeptidase [Terracidiphilus sp.]